MNRAQVLDSEIDFYIDLLCDVNFFGIQSSGGGFRYASQEVERQTLRQVAKRLVISQGWSEESYEVNPAFYQELQIE